MTGWPRRGSGWHLGPAEQALGLAEQADQRLPVGLRHTREPLRIERVCEVKYDHLQGDRFRHATTFKRWRPDKRPAD